jgi:DNA-directed RNA polymerase specialized sigma24 family protein
MRYFEWRGAPFPEDHTDETINRVARKIGEGVDIKNIGGYCYEVARLVLLETLKGPDSRRTGIEAVHHAATAANLYDEAAEKEAYLTCLEVCLEGLSARSRELIVDYYRDDKRGRIDRRKILADRLGLRREALANRAQRLRDKLERCVGECLKKKPTI